jgi:hypothetical protein
MLYYGEFMAIEIKHQKEIAEILSKGLKTNRSPVLSNIPAFEGCYIYKNKIYDTFNSWGWIRVFQIEKSDTQELHRDIEDPRPKFTVKYIPQIYDELL